MIVEIVVLTTIITTPSLRGRFDNGETAATGTHRVRNHSQLQMCKVHAKSKSIVHSKKLFKSALSNPSIDKHRDSRFDSATILLRHSIPNTFLKVSVLSEV